MKADHLFTASAVSRHPPVPFPEWGDGVMGRPGRHRCALVVENRTVSQASFAERELAIDGIRVSVAGLGGVRTSPARRHRGYATAVIGHALVYARLVMRVDLAMLFCRTSLAGFYARLGWTMHQGDEIRVVCDQVSGSTVMPASLCVGLIGVRHPVPTERQTLMVTGLPW